MKGTKSKTEALYVPSMWRGFKIHENIPSEEIDDIELVGDDFMPSTYISFTPTFKYLGTTTSWDLRECNDVQARIKAANKLFGSAKATFWSNSRVAFGLRMRFYKAIIVNVLLWGGESWAIKSKEVHSHADSLKRIGEESLLEDGATVKAPFVRKQRGITVNPQVRDLFRLIQSESWPAMMEKYFGHGGGRRCVGNIGLMEMHCSGPFRDCRRGKEEGGCCAGCWPPTGNGASHTKRRKPRLRSFLLPIVARRCFSKGRLFLRASRVTEP